VKLSVSFVRFRAPLHPGLGQVGPASNFGTEFQLWVLTFAMLMGRLGHCRCLVLFRSAVRRK
jgi:trk system potassium uptake protein TrkH